MGNLCATSAKAKNEQSVGRPNPGPSKDKKPNDTNYSDDSEEALPIIEISKRNPFSDIRPFTPMQTGRISSRMPITRDPSLNSIREFLVTSFKGVVRLQVIEGHINMNSLPG